MLTAVTLSNVNTSVSSHSMDHAENDEFSFRLDYSSRKWRISSPAVRLIDGNHVIRQKLLNNGDKVNINTHKDLKLQIHGKRRLQLLLPMSTLRSQLNP